MGGMHFGFWPRRRYYGTGGGGCCGGTLGSLLIFIFILVFILPSLFSFARVSYWDSYPEQDYDVLYEGIVYDEYALQDYADEQYQIAFGDADAYEDNLLLVFLIDEESYYDFYYIAWVGDHIQDDIYSMLGGSGSELDDALLSYVNETSYKYSLDSDLAAVVKALSDEITALGLDSSYTCEEEHIQAASRLTNYTDLPMTEDTVISALAAFTEATGIPMVIVVDYATEVFEYSASSSSSPVGGVTSSTTVTTTTNGRSQLGFILAICLIVVIVVVFLYKRKQEKGDFDDDVNNYRNYEE